jgi:hypothetical protein
MPKELVLEVGKFYRDDNGAVFEVLDIVSTSSLPVIACCVLEGHNLSTSLEDVETFKINGSYYTKQNSTYDLIEEVTNPNN